MTFRLLAFLLCVMLLVAGMAGVAGSQILTRHIDDCNFLYDNGNAAMRVQTHGRKSAGRRAVGVSAAAVPSAEDGTDSPR